MLGKIALASPVNSLDPCMVHDEDRVVDKRDQVRFDPKNMGLVVK